MIDEKQIMWARLKGNVEQYIVDTVNDTIMNKWPSGKLFKISPERYSQAHKIAIQVLSKCYDSKLFSNQEIINSIRILKIQGYMLKDFELGRIHLDFMVDYHKYMPLLHTKPDQKFWITHKDYSKKIYKQFRYYHGV